MSNDNALMFHKWRVLNLISRIDFKNASVKKQAIIRLLEWQPGAKRIRFETRCGVGRCRSKLSMSYQLDDHSQRERDKDGVMWEDCAYYCPSCGFSNAGGRPVKRDKS